MDKQVSNLCKTISYFLHIISRIRKYLTKESCETLIHSLVTSKFDLNNTLLYGVPGSRIHTLQLLQNTAARIVLKAPRYCHITPLLKQLHWLPIYARIEFKIAVTVFKCLHELAPQYLADLIQKHSPSRSLRSSSKSLLVIPKTRTKFGERAFSISGPTVWNNLPHEIRFCMELKKFKSSLKTFLFKKFYT